MLQILFSKVVVCVFQRQLNESRADVSRQEANVKRLTEQLTSAEQHIQHLNGEVGASLFRVCCKS